MSDNLNVPNPFPPASFIEAGPPTVTLGGSALFGVAPHLLAPSSLLTMLSEPTVRLGRRPPDPSCQPPHLHSHFDLARMTTPPPTSLNRRDKAAASLSRMYLNDRFGCCVISGKGHYLGLVSANDSDSAGVVLATDQEIQSQYVGICGPGDQGCQITAVLDVMVRKGFQAGGKLYKLDGYCAIDWTNQLLTQVALFLGGATTIGINLPEAWTQNAVWDVTNTQIVGGHDVTCIDYGPDGVYISSWGRVYLITWRAFLSTKWIEEHYFLLSPLWYGGDGVASACGVNVATLKADLATFRQGQVPSIDPTPTPPPPDPNPTPTPPPNPNPTPTPPPGGTFVIPASGKYTTGTTVDGKAKIIYG